MQIDGETVFFICLALVPFATVVAVVCLRLLCRSAFTDPDSADSAFGLGLVAVAFSAFWPLGLVLVVVTGAALLSGWRGDAGRSTKKK